MAKTNYDLYMEKRLKNLSPEGKIAQEVFGEAYQIAATLLQLRRVKKLSQAQLAERSGVQQADISRMENGNMIPNVSTFLKLLGALDTDITLKVKPRRTRSRKSALFIEQLTA